MSKRFRTQDHFRYKKLGKRWRRPVGWQSKLRIRRGGSGLKVSIGYRSPVVSRGKVGGADVINVYNAGDLLKIGSSGAARIAAGVGAKKAILIEAKAKEMSIRIVNMKKIRRAEKIRRMIEKRRENRIVKKKAEAEKKEEAKAGENSTEKKTGEKKGIEEKEAAAKKEAKTGSDQR